jgi:serine/threonine-protein kinase
MVASVRVWYAHWQTTHLLIAGVVLHVYGLAAIAFASRTLDLLTRLDPTAPVVVLQERVAALRRWYVLSGWAIGLPWWFLWMPAFMVVTRLIGVDVYARAPLLFVYGTFIGVAGIAVTWGFHWLARRPGWTRLAKMADDSLVAESVRRAQAAVDEVKRFAADDSGSGQ